MTIPLIQLKQITREFTSGDSIIQVLKAINLTINAGEMVAIVGASGSGKSTLMNILGCLDKPSSGEYLLSGRLTRRLNSDELAELRREHFGFIFQRYHLLNALTAEGNVEMPAIYAGIDRQQRQQRAQALLTRLGLGEKLTNKPTQLSGGQQQRVSIARALMNGGQIILADEPTGALDKQSGQEVLAILQNLHQQGHTIIMVTHDMQIAQNAQRIIEISDGQIISDTMNPSFGSPAIPSPKSIEQTKTNDNFTSIRDRFFDAFKMALLSMASQRLRTFLTMLGIIIGIASVVSVVALGQGSRQKILADINSMGTSTLDIYAGSGFGDRNAARITTLRSADADALKQQNYIHSATPNLSTSAYFRVGSQALTGTINGVGEQFFAVRGYTLYQGQVFNHNAILNSAQEAVIDENTANRLFAKQNPIGQIMHAGSLPVRIIGIVKRDQQGFGSNENLNIWLPYTTVMNRITGQTSLRSITVRVKDNVDMAVAEQAVTQLLIQRHGSKDFFIFNTDSVRQMVESTTATMTLLVSMIALISLVVGGIGVMNIMLVSVTERTKEIGVRMAVGARSSDILQQFLIESILVCLIGGTLGILLSLLIGVIFAYFVTDFPMQFSISAIIAAFSCSSLIGILFGFFPARRAANLDPIHALERE
jgi:macrolide transport system ATP-binding/permease protein